MPVAIPAVIAAGTAIYGGIQASKQAKAQKEAADQALANRPTYQPSPYQAQALADAQSRVNGYNPALAALAQQQQQSQANTAAFAQRNASSGAQALAAAAGAQEQTQAALPKIAAAQADYQQQNLQNYYKQLSGSTDEYHNQANDALSRYSDIFNYHLGRLGAANQTGGQALGLAGQAAGSLGRIDWGKIFGNNNTWQNPGGTSFSGLNTSGGGMSTYAPTYTAPDYLNVSMP